MILDFLEIGTIVGTHGLQGELRVNPACDAPDFFRQFRVLYWDAQGRQPVRVLGARVHQNVALLRLEGVDSAEAAQQLKNRRLWFRRADAPLEEGRYFIAELLGCAVFDAAGQARYGTLCDVSQTGANDVWHIQADDGNEILIPAIPDVVKSVDIAGGRIEVAMLDGLLD